MYALSLGVSHIGTTLPAPAYALLSGLNAATVGQIALAAVQLSEKAITDKITRMLVFLGATAGMLYNALWYFPLLIFLAGPITIVWDFGWLHQLCKVTWERMRRRGGTTHGNPEVEMNSAESRTEDASSSPPHNVTQHTSDHEDDPRIIPEDRNLKVSWKTGTAIVVGFLATFVVVMVLRGVAKNRPLLFRLFSNMYLAGTVIFGGGPVVIPLLRQ